MDTVKIFITNLAKYNAGDLVGDWVELPIYDDDELTETIAKVIESETDEHFITDYEGDVVINEHDSIVELNDFVREIEGFSESDQIAAIFLVNEINMSYAESLEHYQDVTAYDVKTLKELAEYLVDEGYYGDIPESIIRYIDYDAIANDLHCGGGYHEFNGMVLYYL